MKGQQRCSIIGMWNRYMSLAWKEFKRWITQEKYLCFGWNALNYNASVFMHETSWFLLLSYTLIVRKRKMKIFLSVTSFVRVKKYNFVMEMLHFEIFQIHILIHSFYLNKTNFFYSIDRTEVSYAQSCCIVVYHSQ